MDRENEKYFLDSFYQNQLKDLHRQHSDGWSNVDKRRQEEDRYIDTTRSFMLDIQRKQEDQFTAQEFKKEEDILFDQWNKSIRDLDEKPYF
jgi:hypothetical protein